MGLKGKIQKVSVVAPSTRAILFVHELSLLLSGNMMNTRDVFPLGNEIVITMHSLVLLKCPYTGICCLSIFWSNWEPWT